MDRSICTLPERENGSADASQMVVFVFRIAVEGAGGRKTRLHQPD